MFFFVWTCVGARLSALVGWNSALLFCFAGTSFGLGLGLAPCCNASSGACHVMSCNASSGALFAVVIPILCGKLIPFDQERPLRDLFYA